MKLLILYIIILISLLHEYSSNFATLQIIQTLYNPHNYIGLIKVLIYLCVVILFFINFILIALMRKKKIFYLLIFFISIFTILDYSYYLNGLPLGFNRVQFITAILESQNIFNAITSFYLGIFKAIIIFISIIVLVYFLRKYIKRRFYHIPLILLPFSFLISFFIIKQSNNIYNFISPIKIPTEIFLAYYQNMLDIPYCKRNDVYQKPIQKSHYKNIILFIDESVRGDYLSINGYKDNTTPFLNSLDNLITLGNISSVANSSHNTNYILRNGLTIKDLPDTTYKTLKKSSIFQYAKKAGYKTIYADAQVINSRYQGYISSYDFKNIDIFLSSKSGEISYLRDRLMIKQLSEILNNSKEKHFIYFIKFGSHWNYNFTYPEKETQYKPVLKNLESMNFENREKSINTYKNSICWGVDKFFKYVLDNLDINNTLILYTSDHGQNLLENNTTITHGVIKNPPSSMAIVPFLIYSKDIKYIKSKFYNIKKNKYSQYQLFPSLLDLFGYDNDVINIYGEPFWKALPLEQKFYSGSLFNEGYLNRFKMPTSPN